FYAGLVISTRQQRFRKGGQAANIFEPDGGAVDAVEVRTEPHVVRSNQVHDVVDVAHHVFQGGGPIAAQELGAKVHAHDPAVLGQGPDLRVIEVAPVVADGPGVGV